VKLDFSEQPQILGLLAPDRGVSTKGFKVYAARPISDGGTVIFRSLRVSETFGLSVASPEQAAPSKITRGLRPISGRINAIFYDSHGSRPLGLSVVSKSAYQWRWFGQSVAKYSVYQWPSVRPIGDRHRPILSQDHGLAFNFHPVTRARDLNWELTLLTLTQHAGSRGGSAPSAPQSHPTRLTPARKALRASSNSTPYRAARWAGGKISQNHGSAKG
jgi:hypothetical protein